jgi:glycosyltransferase involved in cell wall biosynthesis
MKILHICAIGGTAKTLLLPQIDYLLSRNLSVEVACSPGVESEQLQQQGYKIHPIQIDRKISPLLNLKSIYQLAQLMRREQYDLVHVHTPIAAVLGRVAARLSGVKSIVYTAHGFPFHDQSPPLEYQAYFTVEKVMGYVTDMILTQNHEDLITAQKQGLCARDKVHYLGNGVDIDRFDRTKLHPDKQLQLRRSVGIPDSANLIVGTIGRLIRTKGSEQLIEAAASLVGQFPNIHILIIGGKSSGESAPLYAEIVDKIQKLGLEPHITLTGVRYDIPELLGLMDVFTLPTFFGEGLPRSILEAMAMSLPVVTTDIRGCREAVIHQETGLIVRPRNSEELTQALAKLLSDANLRQAYGEAGRLRVEAQYDENFVFQRLADYYQTLGISAS